MLFIIKGPTVCKTNVRYIIHVCFAESLIRSHFWSKTNIYYSQERMARVNVKAS